MARVAMARMRSRRRRGAPPRKARFKLWFAMHSESMSDLAIQCSTFASTLVLRAAINVGHPALAAPVVDTQGTPHDLRLSRASRHADGVEARTLRGGDIDLLVELPAPAEDALGLSVRLSARIQRQTGLRKIDVLIGDPASPGTPLLRQARQDAVAG